MLSLENRTTELAIEAANTPTDCRGINSKKTSPLGQNCQHPLQRRNIAIPAVLLTPAESPGGNIHLSVGAIPLLLRKNFATGLSSFAAGRSWFEPGVGGSSKHADPP